MNARKPWQHEGSTGFIREDGTRQVTGSMMGRRDMLPDDTSSPIKLHMQRLQLVDGAYDQGGAYWGGGGSPLWCAYGDEATIYVRAINRADAKAKVQTLLPTATFYR